MQLYKNKKSIFVRADFFADGKIIPLGVIDKNGSTIIIDKIEQNEKKLISKNIFENKFYCISKDFNFWLYFIDGIWYIDEK